MLTLTLATLLLFAAPTQAHEFDAALAELQEASRAANNRSNERSLTALAEACEVMNDFPAQLEQDPDARELLVLARLNVVRGYYVKLGRREQAEVLLDDMLRWSMVTEEHAMAFGPEVLELYHERLSSLREVGTATLEIVCHTPCEVVLDLQPVADRSFELFLGPHRLLVRSVDGSVEGFEQTIALTQANAAPRIVEFGEPAPEPAPEPEPPAPTVVDEGPRWVPPTISSPPRRVLPRAAEIVGVTAGVGLLISGALMLGYDGRCRDGSTDTTQCPLVWQPLGSTPTAATITAVGGALLITSVVLLAVDEVRLRRHQQARPMLSRRGSDP